MIIHHLTKEKKVVRMPLGPYFIALSDIHAGDEKPCKERLLQGLLVTFQGKRSISLNGKKPTGTGNAGTNFPSEFIWEGKVLQLSLPLPVFGSSMKIFQGPFRLCFSELRYDFSGIRDGPLGSIYTVRQ